MILSVSNSEIIEHGKKDNITVLQRIYEADYEHFVIERIQSYGGRVGQTTFDTCEWSGRFIEAATARGIPVDRLKRKSIVARLTGDATNGDKHVRAAMVSAYGKVSLAGDEWQALGAGTAFLMGLREV